MNAQMTTWAAFDIATALASITAKSALVAAATGVVSFHPDQFLSKLITHLG